MTDQKEPYWNRMVPELTVTDFSSSLRFYTDAPGFSVMIKRSNPDFAYINLGEAQLMLEQFNKEGWNTAELVKPFGRGINFQIEVDDIKAIHDRLAAQGVPLYRELQDNHYNTGETVACQREFLVQDPDGYLLRFSQYID